MPAAIWIDEPTLTPIVNSILPVRRQWTELFDRLLELKRRTFASHPDGSDVLGSVTDEG